MHSRNELYKSWMQKEDVGLLRIAEACACSVTVMPSRAKHFSAGLRMFAARMLRKVEAIWRLLKNPDISRIVVQRAHERSAWEWRSEGGCSAVF